jgi:glycosyltransferase involved in cell wall biosynthesis
MLKVGIEATGLTAQKGTTGWRRYLHCLIDNLIPYAAKGNIHLYLYSTNRNREDIPAGFLSDRVTLRAAPFARGWWWLGMGMAMKLDRLDLFHFPSPRMPTYCPAPAVVTFHDLAALSLEDGKATRDQHYLPDALDAARRAKTLIAVSRSASDELARHTNRTDVAVILEGVDRKQFYPVPDAAAEIEKRYHFGPYILCVGTLQSRKNQVRLVQAFERIQGDVPHSLVFVGRDEPSTGGLHTYLTAYPNPRVYLLGYVQDTLLPLLYTAADVFALPSLWEGFGLPLLEAMACGTPVLTSGVSSLAEVAGDAAIFASPENIDDIAARLRALLIDDALRQRLVEAGVARAEAFSWEQAAAQTIEVYRQTAASTAHK